MLSTTKRLLGFFRRYWITPTSIWLRQQNAWIELRRDEIAALKFETVSHIIVRYYDGQRFVVNLYGYSNPAYKAICRTLRDAMRHNEQARGLWDGARALKHYD